MNDRPHKKLIAWQKSVDFVKRIYEMTSSFPEIERYTLQAQLRRAAISVPSNLAEGLTRRTKNDKLHFINIAQGSLSELDTQIEIALRLGYVQQKEYESIEGDLMEIQTLFSGLSRSLN